MKNRLYLIGILVFLSSYLFFGLLGTLIGVVFPAPKTTLGTCLLLTSFVGVSSFLFHLLSQFQYKNFRLILLFILPIALVILNNFMGGVTEQIESVDFVAKLKFYGYHAVFQKIFILIITILLLVTGREKE